jgi:hypothetical protein
VTTDALRPFRDTIDTASSVADADRAGSRGRRGMPLRTRSSWPRFKSDAGPGSPEHDPPEAEIRELLGAELGNELAALYRGGDGWTSRAIDLLAPLNDVAYAR